MRTKKPWHHKEVLVGMYSEQLLTIRQIAGVFGTSASNVLYWLRKFDIALRSFDIGKWNKGKERTPEEKAILAEIARVRFLDPRDHPMYGKHHSEESKRKMSETKKQRKLQKEEQTNELVQN